jgi:hypothetical protein
MRDFGWLVRNDDALSHQRKIGGGGYGEVHEVPLFETMLTTDIDTR